MYESGRQRPYEVAVATPPAAVDPVAEAMAQARALQILAASTGTVELSGEREPMVWVPAPGNQFMAVPREMLPAGYLHQASMPAPQQRDLTLVPLIYPRAQLVAAGGICAGAAGTGIGWGPQLTFPALTPSRRPVQ
ncbi:hypothetical protein [Streptomyces sp. NPDC055287]